MVSDRRTAAFSLIASGTLALVASVGLSVQFGWPDILDAPAAEVLPAFAEIAGTVQTLFLLQMAGSLVLIPGVIALHLLLARSRGTDAALLTVTAFGVLAPVIQSLGWIRWPLVVPGLAERYLDPSASAATTEATAATYELINAYAGGALGENLGWLLQGVWAVGLGDPRLARRRRRPRLAAPDARRRRRRLDRHAGPRRLAGLRPADRDRLVDLLRLVPGPAGPGRGCCSGRRRASPPPATPA